MTAEEYYKRTKYPKLDKFDKKASKFDYYGITQFAEEYHQFMCLLKGYTAQAKIQDINIKQDKMFWRRLLRFVSDIQVNDCMGSEEKEMIINVCNNRLNIK